MRLHPKGSTHIGISGKWLRERLRQLVELLPSLDLQSGSQGLIVISRELGQTRPGDRTFTFASSDVALPFSIVEGDGVVIRGHFPLELRTLPLFAQAISVHPASRRRTASQVLVIDFAFDAATAATPFDRTR